MMPRYTLIIEYDGGAFNGWQRQPEQPTIQATIERAVFGFSGEAITLVAAGRTDTGVHATGQVAHLDLKKDWPPERVREAINAHLRAEAVSIVETSYAPDGFDARFSAKARHYRYQIINRRAPLALDDGRAWHVKYPLDASAMHEAAQLLIGTFDFTTFRHVHCQAKSPVKTLDRLDVERIDENIIIHASARSFMHNQVRSLAGSLVQVGAGRWQKPDLKAALDAKDRARCGPVAPPHGLYFYKVDY